MNSVKSIILVLASAWLILLTDGSFAYDRLPSGLESLLNRRTIDDPQIDVVSLGAFGSWFIRFLDGECLWESLPKSLEKLLIKMIRKGHEALLIALSLSSPSNYFAAIGDNAEISFAKINFRKALAQDTHEQTL